jgi:hypothetical protein
MNFDTALNAIGATFWTRERLEEAVQDDAIFAALCFEFEVDVDVDEDDPDYDERDAQVIQAVLDEQLRRAGEEAS